MSAYVENPEAIGDPNQTPRVRLWPAGELVSSERFNKLDAEVAATARAERAEAAIQRVRKLANGWSFIDDESVTVDELRDQILAALDSTDPPPDAQRPEERSDEGPKKPTPPCPHCGPGYRYGDEGCRHMIPPSDAGLPADGEERK